MHVNPGISPPQGPHYEVAPGVVLRAPTFELLYSQITEYRVRHALIVGDPKRDVDNYVCGKWPHFCHPDKQEKAAPESPRLTTRVAEWAAKLIREMPSGGYDLVDTREAARRADICRVCPFQESWKQRCTPCNASTEALLSTVRRMKKTGVDNGVQGCSICGIDNQTAIWLEEKTIRPGDELRAKLPQNCYLKAIQ